MAKKPKHDAAGNNGSTVPGKACSIVPDTMLGDDVALVDRVCGNPALPGPRLLHLKIRMGTRTDLPRPRLAPEEVAARLTAHVAGRRPPPPGRG